MDNISVLNKNYFRRSTNVKLLTRIKGNSVNNCNFLKFVISVRATKVVVTCPGGQKKKQLGHWLF